MLRPKDWIVEFSLYICDRALRVHWNHASVSDMIILLAIGARGSMDLRVQNDF